MTFTLSSYIYSQTKMEDVNQNTNFTEQRSVKERFTHHTQPVSEVNYCISKGCNSYTLDIR